MRLDERAEQLVSNVTALKRQPDPDVIETIELMLKEAKAGQLTAFVALCDGCGDDGAPAVAQHSAGQLDLASLIFSFECWKHRAIRASDLDSNW